MHPNVYVQQPMLRSNMASINKHLLREVNLRKTKTYTTSTNDKKACRYFYSGHP
jgi:hypothetical protein